MFVCVCGGGGGVSHIVSSVHVCVYGVFHILSVVSMCVCAGGGGGVSHIVSSVSWVFHIILLPVVSMYV